jgi:hypothetical protein
MDWNLWNFETKQIFSLLSCLSQVFGNSDENLTNIAWNLDLFLGLLELNVCDDSLYVSVHFFFTSERFVLISRVQINENFIINSTYYMLTQMNISHLWPSMCRSVIKSYTSTCKVFLYIVES